MEMNLNAMPAFEHADDNLNSLLSYGVKYTQIAFALDASKSTEEKLPGSDKTIHELCVDALRRFLTELSGKLGKRLLVSIYVFNGKGVSRLMSNTLLDSIDIESLPASFPKPYGLTPMGSAVCQALEDMDAFRREKVKDCYRFTQPILSVLTDGRATDDMTRAIEMVDERLGHRPRQHLVCIPVGIGHESDFDHLKRMLQSDPYANELCVLGAESDFGSYVRIINATTIAVSSGQEYTGLSGLDNNASIFTGSVF